VYVGRDVNLWGLHRVFVPRNDSELRIRSVLRDPNEE
jgi:hypothetical protein